MKVVIEVPESIYHMVCNTETYGIFRFNSARAIAKGIALEDIRKEIMAIGNWERVCDIPNRYLEDAVKILDRHIKGEDNAGE